MGVSINDENELDIIFAEIDDLISQFEFDDPAISKNLEMSFHKLASDFNKKIDSLKSNNVFVLKFEDKNTVYLNFLAQLRIIKSELTKYLEINKKCREYLKFLDLETYDSDEEIDDPIFIEIDNFISFLNIVGNEDLIDNFNDFVSIQKDKINKYLSDLALIIKKLHLFDLNNYDDFFEKNESVKIPSINKIVSDFENELDDYIRKNGIRPELLSYELIDKFESHHDYNKEHYLHLLKDYLKDDYYDKLCKCRFLFTTNDYISKRMEEIRHERSDGIPINDAEKRLKEWYDVEMFFDRLKKTTADIIGIKGVYLVDSEGERNESHGYIYYKKLLLYKIINKKIRGKRYFNLAELKPKKMIDFAWAWHSEHEISPALKVDDIDKLKGIKKIGDFFDGCPIYEYGEFPSHEVSIEEANLHPCKENETGIKLNVELGYDNNNMIYEENGIRYVTDGDNAYVFKPIQWIYDKNLNILFTATPLFKYRSRERYAPYDDRDELEDYFKNNFLGDIATDDMFTITNPLVGSVVEEIDKLFSENVYLSNQKNYYKKIYSDLLKFLLKHIKEAKNEVYDLNFEIGLNKYYDKLVYIRNNLILCINTFNNASKLLQMFDDNSEQTEIGKMISDINSMFSKSLGSASLMNSYSKIISSEQMYLLKIIDSCLDYDFSKPFKEITFEELEIDLRNKLHPLLESLYCANKLNYDVNAVMKYNDDNYRETIVDSTIEVVKNLIADILSKNPTNEEIDKVKDMQEVINNLDNIYNDGKAKMNALLSIEIKLASISSDLDFRKNMAKNEDKYKISKIN